MNKNFVIAFITSCLVVFTIAGITFYNKKNTTDAPLKKETTLMKINEDERYVNYGGSIVISGQYVLDAQSILGDTLCFYPNDETGYLIPRDQNLWGPGNGDTRTPWFCFSNQEEAKNLLEINDASKINECLQGAATIRVSKYIVDKLESEVFDTARLDDVLSKENYTTDCY